MTLRVVYYKKKRLKKLQMVNIGLKDSTNPTMSMSKDTEVIIISTIRIYFVKVAQLQAKVSPFQGSTRIFRMEWQNGRLNVCQILLE